MKSRLRLLVVAIAAFACTSEKGPPAKRTTDDPSETGGTGGASREEARTGGTAGTTPTGGAAGGTGGGAAPAGGMGGSNDERDASRSAGGEGGAMDAGPDVASNPGSTDAGPSPQSGPTCVAGKYKFCEDFESGAAGGLPDGWSDMGGGGHVINVQTDQHHSGGKSLKSSVTGNNTGRVQKSLAALGAELQGTHWGRAYFKVQVPAPKAFMHIVFVSLDLSRVLDTVQAEDGSVGYLYNLPDDSCCKTSPKRWRFDDQWHCAEWYVEAKTQTNKFFLDSVEIPEITHVNDPRVKIHSFSNIIAGNTIFHPFSPAFVSWIDDLAINDTRIGCGP